MNLHLDKQGSDLLVEVEGRIDANNATEFQSKFGDIDDDISRIIFDLSNLRYISSAGLRAFLLLYKNMKLKNGEIILRKPNNLVYSIFETTGMTDLLMIES